MKKSSGKFRDWIEPSDGRDRQCLVIAEVAQAHDGSLGTAHAFIDAIAVAGADGVKFQTHIAAEESTPGEPWRVKFSYQDKTRYDYWQRMEFTEEQWYGLKQHAAERGLLFFSSPFSMQAVELLERIGVAAWKVASGEVTNIALLRRMTQSGLPFIVSSGMSSWADLDGVVELLEQAGAGYALLQCTSAYPCPPEKVGLNVMAEFRARYGCPVGLSDHSAHIYPGLAAAVLGAEVVEVHVTLSREMFGPDVSSSLTTGELRQLVEGVRFIERMLHNPVDKEQAALDMQSMKALFTKSIVAARDLAAGIILGPGDLTCKKPGTGLPPERLDDMLGKRLARGLARDECIQEGDWHL